MNLNPFRKAYSSDMAPPSLEEQRRSSRFKMGLIVLSVAGAASFGGYMLAEREHSVRRVERPLDASINPIDKDLGGTPDEDVSGTSWALLRKARAGDGDAQYEIAHWYLANRPEEPTGMRWMMAAARNGHPAAVGWMVYLYGNGDNRAVDRIRSAGWAIIAREIGAPLPDHSRPVAYISGLSEADLRRAEIVAESFRVEVRNNYRRRLATRNGGS